MIVLFCLARVELENGGHLLWEFPASTKERFSPDKEYLGIHLIDYGPDWARLRGPALLVISKVEDRMERVGLAGLLIHIMKYIVRMVFSKAKLSTASLYPTGHRTIHRW